jgi:hypothetical protein
VLGSSHPSSCSAVRHSLPQPHPSQHETCSFFRTRMAHRSFDGLRCGCRICGLRSVVQSSAHSRRTCGPAPARRVEIVEIVFQRFPPFDRIIIRMQTMDPQRQIDYVHNVLSALVALKCIDPMTAAHCRHPMAPHGETRGFSGLRRALQGGEAGAEALRARDVCTGPLAGDKRVSNL